MKDLTALAAGVTGKLDRGSSCVVVLSMRTTKRACSIRRSRLISASWTACRPGDHVLQPKNLPAAVLMFLPAAAAAVKPSSRRGGVRPSAWRSPSGGSRWPDVAGRSRVTTSPADAVAMKTKGELAKVEGLIAAGRFDDALSLLERFQNPRAGAHARKCSIGRGGPGWGCSEQPGSADAVRDARGRGWRSCGWQSIIPCTRLRPRVFSAGEVCRRAGRSDLAANLWSELVQTHPADQVWGERARREMPKPSSRPAAVPSGQKR